jgi:hypothetical protein
MQLLDSMIFNKSLRSSSKPRFARASRKLQSNQSLALALERNTRTRRRLRPLRQLAKPEASLCGVCLIPATMQFALQCSNWHNRCAQHYQVVAIAEPLCITPYVCVVCSHCTHNTRLVCKDVFEQSAKEILAAILHSLSDKDPRCHAVFWDCLLIVMQSMLLHAISCFSGA